MVELSKDEEKQIEQFLYKEVKTIIEGHYNQESAINIKKRDSEKLIFKDRENAIRMIANHVSNYAAEKNLNKSLVMEYLLTLVEKDINSDTIFREEYNEAKKIMEESGDCELDR